MSKEEELQTLVALKKQHKQNIIDKMDAINNSKRSIRIINNRIKKLRAKQNG